MEEVEGLGWQEGSRKKEPLGACLLAQGPWGLHAELKRTLPADIARCGLGLGWLCSTAQLAPSGSCGQWVPVFVDTTVAFVHSSPNHQLENAGRGQGPA